LLAHPSDRNHLPVFEEVELLLGDSAWYREILESQRWSPVLVDEKGIDLHRDVHESGEHCIPRILYVYAYIVGPLDLLFPLHAE